MSLRLRWSGAIAMALLLPASARSQTLYPAWRLTRVQMVSRADGWAMADTRTGIALLRTRDSGRHWADVTPPGCSSAHWTWSDIEAEQMSNAAAFLGAQRAWLLSQSGQETIVVESTNDGGRHWSQSRFLSHAHPANVQFLNPHDGFLLATGGPAAGLMPKTTYRTLDGGRTWTRTSQAGGTTASDSPGALPIGGFYPTGMTFRDAERGWVSGSIHADFTPLYQTDNGGRAWRFQTLRLPKGMMSVANTYAPVFFGDGKRGILPVDFEGHALVFATQDGGAAWHPASAKSLPAEADTAFFCDLQHGWMVGTSSRTLYRTGNGGRTWQAIALGRDWNVGTAQAQLDFLSPQTGWALTTDAYSNVTGDSRCSLQATQDGGQHWRVVWSSAAQNAEDTRRAIQQGKRLPAAARRLRLNRLLTLATENSDLPSVRMLLAAGADPNARLAVRHSTLPGPTVLMLASADEDWKVAQALVAQGANVSLRGADALSTLTDIGSFGTATALTEALQLPADTPREARRQVLLVRLLLSRGADANAKDADGSPALVDVSQGFGFGTGTTPVLLQLLLAQGANVNAPDRQGNTALMENAGNPAAARLLLAHGAHINAQNTAGDTALMHWASGHGPSSAAAVAFLLAHGANPNLADRGGNTALILAVSAPSRETLPIVRLLLAHGAAVNTRDKQGRTALHWVHALSGAAFLNYQFHALAQVLRQAGAVD